MLTGAPANFESVEVDSVVNDWLFALKGYGVEALLVLGPEPYSMPGGRRILVVHPPHLMAAADALAQSKDFGGNTSMDDRSEVEWRTLEPPDATHSDSWRGLWHAKGYRSFVRLAFSLPGGRAFECYAFSARSWGSQDEPAQVAWHTWNLWARLKKSIAHAYCPLSPREVQSLRLAFDGFTAKTSAEVMGCAERTVNFHITNAMNKLKVDNKLAAVQRAIYLGCI